MKHIKIGGRGSLLSLTQINQTIELLQESFPDIFFEVIPITTQGDKIQDKALWEVDGNNFFTKELDQALINNTCDVTIHSHKDLGVVRPKDFEIAATPKRSYPHDILLIKNSTLDKIKNGQLKKILIGTSSPRRIANLTSKLPKIIQCEIETKILRGNVNTRIEKLQKDHFDAIVLALAGLERLAKSKNQDQVHQLEELIKNLNFTILPLSLFPTAASQGAIALEINKNNPNYQHIKDVISSIHCLNTYEEISRERKSLSFYGGGCHLAVGITTQKIKDFFISFHKGNKVSGEVVNKILIEQKNKLKNDLLINNISTSIFICQKEETCLPSISHSKKFNFIFDQILNNLQVELHNEMHNEIHNEMHFENSKIFNFFVASKKAFSILQKNMQNLNKSISHEDTLIFTAGTTTSEYLFKNGIWVNGTSDSMGSSHFLSLLESKFIKLISKNFYSKHWKTISKDRVQSTIGDLVSTYSIRNIANSNIQKIKQNNVKWVQELQNTNVFFWPSYSYYKIYKNCFPEIFNAKNKLLFHCTGLGKTYDALTEVEENVYPFFNIQHFIDFLGENHDGHE